MSFTIYNLPASVYNRRCKSIVSRARQKYPDLDSVSLEFQLIPIRKALESKRPASYESFTLRDDLAFWLSLEAPKFFFKEAPLLGLEKTRIISQIKANVTKHLHRDPELAEILIEFYKFLQRYAIVFAE